MRWVDPRSPGAVPRGERNERRWRLKGLAVCCVVALVSGGDAAPVRAVAHLDKGGERQGFWWKKEPARQEKETDADTLGPPPSEEELLKLHPKQIAKLIEDYRDNALWKMQPKEVTWYYTLQDFARRRARAFMNVTDVVMLENPALNMNTVYPESPPGQDARLEQYNQSITKRLDEERERAGLVLLTRQGCAYCEAQRAALKYFQARHGWEVKEVDIDESPQIAAQFGVEYTPTTVVVFRGTDQWMPVSVGVDTVPSIEEGLYKALRLIMGETTPEQFDVHEYQDGGPYDPTRRSSR
jgi:conjugal transfer pilus assembly protein TraF